MPSELEYALMAGVSYRSTRADLNRFPIPDTWQEVPLSFVTIPSGFEAISFQRGSEIVISFAGTAQAVDWWANGGLATGVGAQQLLDAAAYTMQILEEFKDNPNATISFTGHSLGGGLASLMGVFFDRPAFAFDAAPFRNSATNAKRQDLVTYLRTIGEQ